VFEDRQHAGRVLAEHLAAYRDVPDAVVLGIPRGGVVVAAEVARELGLPLDVAVAAKVGAPGNPEYAIGAVAADGEVTANPSAGYSDKEVRDFAGPAFDKVRSQLARLRAGRQPLTFVELTAIVVDDGLATGLTAMAAADWLRREKAARVVVAVPVASASAIRALEGHADEVVAAEVPAGFYAVGQFYRRFGQTEDAEVMTLLGGGDRGAG
jgi:predicted phosphoribosyltransferase